MEKPKVGDVVKYQHWSLKEDDGTPLIETGIVESVGEQGVTLTTEEGAWRAMGFERIEAGRAL